MYAVDDCHEPIIELHDVSFAYDGDQVLSNLNATIKQRDFAGLIGANGAGKTTLLRMIVGLLKPVSGDIRLFGEPIKQFRDWDRIGYVPQKHVLNPQFPASVRDVVLSGLYTRKRWLKRLTSADHRKADEAMLALGIEQLADKRIGQLSGGQQQRVFLARAIINNPELLILDEPFTGVDEATQVSFFHILRHMHQHHHITILMVSHELQMMRDYLGHDPLRINQRLSLYIRHSHGNPCSGTDMIHSLRHLRANQGDLAGKAQAVTGSSSEAPTDAEPVALSGSDQGADDQAAEVLAANERGSVAPTNAEDAEVTGFEQARTSEGDAGSDEEPLLAAARKRES